jgi:4-amino-4-deoxy-L-arabinose transferase-like glycosyltransferase
MSGTTSAIVPQVFACATGAVAIALLLMVGWWLRGPVTGMVIAASVVIVPQFLMEATSQYADVPLSCCYLASLISVALGTRHHGDWRWLLLGGLLAGAALWTKNEGVLFAGCAVLAILTTQRVVGSFRSALVATGAFAAGVLPFFIVWAGMKLLIPTGNDLMSNHTFSTIWSRGLDVSRHAAILSYAWFLLTRLPDRLGLLLLLAYVFASGRVQSVAPAATSALTLGLTTIGYYIVFLMTPNDLHWQLTTSASRLAIQLWPGLLLTMTLLIGDSPSGRCRGEMLPSG